jgi:hypothetical protein
MTEKYQVALAEDSSDAEKGSDGAEEDSGDDSDSSHTSQHTDASEQVLDTEAYSIRVWFCPQLDQNFLNFLSRFRKNPQRKRARWILMSLLTYLTGSWSSPNLSIDLLLLSIAQMDIIPRICDLVA